MANPLEPAGGNPGERLLHPREQLWTELACLGTTGALPELGDRVRLAFQAGEVPLESMQEFSLMFSVYCGWGLGAAMDGTIRRQWTAVMEERGAEIRPWPVLGNDTLGPADWEERLAGVEAMIKDVVHIDPPPRDTPYTQLGVLGFVFGQVWRRPGLSIRERRIIATACCGAVGAAHAARHHVSAAVRAADLTAAEVAELAAELRRRSPRAAEIGDALSAPGHA